MKTVPLPALALVFLTIFCCRAGAQTYDANGDFVQIFAGSGEPGYLDGQGQLTKFLNPSQIVADTSSNLYVWDSGNHLIRKITQSGTVSTLAGGGTYFEGFGTNVSLTYSSVAAMAIDHANTIWLVVLSGGFPFSGGSPYLLNIGTNGFVSFENGGSGLTNISGTSGVCFDSVNNLYYSGGNIIYRYNPTTGISLPFAGNGTSGYRDGNGTIFPEFNNPGALACDQADNIYVWDTYNARIRRVDQSQNITTIAGPGSAGGIFSQNSDGTGTNASFGSGVAYMVCDNNGNVYFACGNSIRKMDAHTNVVTMAGNFSATGAMNGPGNLASFYNANGLCLSQGTVFVADAGNQLIRDITFNPQPQIVSGANLGIGTYAGVTINGTVGRTYEIQSSPDMGTWTPMATVLLTSTPYLWIDRNPVSGNNFYRAFLLP